VSKFSNREALIFEQRRWIYAELDRTVIGADTAGDSWKAEGFYYEERIEPEAQVLGRCVSVHGGAPGKRRAAL
jgi:hypothetical protein